MSYALDRLLRVTIKMAASADPLRERLMWASEAVMLLTEKDFKDPETLEKYEQFKKMVWKLDEDMSEVEARRSKDDGPVVATCGSMSGPKARRAAEALGDVVYQLMLDDTVSEEDE
jgi:hypothetical protein